MRTRHTTIASLGIVIAAGFWQMAGCSADAEDCSRTNVCSEKGERFIPGPPPGCADSPSSNPDVIKDECGIFVSASAAAGGDGTMAKPFTSLQAALDKAKSAKFRVYACAETYAEEAKADSVSLFGGFDCTNGWSYVTDPTIRATITPTDGVALRMTGSGSLLVQDVVALGPMYSQSALPGEPGKSSIGVVVEKATVEFTRCDLEGRDAQSGGVGESPSDDTQLNGVSGNNGKTICEAGVNNPGGAVATKMCPDGSDSIGGKGGDGGLVELTPFKALAAGDGDDGTPAGMFGQKGLGEPEMTGSWSCQAVGDGKSGANGTKGAPGNGAADAGKVAATGYEGASGTAGSYGKPGQGGGGGGAAKGANNFSCNGNSAPRVGASGGSGGSGGCGGRGGGGGSSGGASIALISVDASVVLADCILRSAVGGAGGRGGNGQAGGAPGGGAAGGAKVGSSTPACKGGDGGYGGDGGPGGGGAGGPSLGVAHVGKAPDKRGDTKITPGTPGEGGPGGDNNVDGNTGANGAAGEIVPF